MTYSIIGRDPNSGEIGIAVQSRYFAAGRLVPWIEAGVGAIASQAFANPTYGHEGLALLKQGVTPTSAIETISAKDPDAAVRQVGMLDAQGRVAVHTGARCVQAAGHAIGDNCVALANMMTHDTVWAAMVSAFEQNNAALADRLLAALQAAEAEGGDIRGRQAASLIVVSADALGHPQLERSVDLRIDDHPDPVGEIARLLRYSRAHQRALNAMNRLQNGDPAGALSDIEASLLEFPRDTEFLGRQAMLLMALGRFGEARETIAAATAIAPNSPEFLMRLADAGIIPVGRELLMPLMPQ